MKLQSMTSHDVINITKEQNTHTTQHDSNFNLKYTNFACLKNNLYKLQSKKQTTKKEVKKFHNKERHKIDLVELS